MFLLTLLVAGNETTRTLLSGTAVVLHEHPDQRAAAGGRRRRWCPAAVEECLRWVTPGPRLLPHRHRGRRGRRARRVEAGDYLCMLYASANRDERIFGDDAARFDVRRPANPVHLAFGFGEHVCLGASLARLEARIFVEELLARFPGYAVTGPAERVLVDDGRRDPVAAGGAGARRLSAVGSCSTAWRSSPSSDSTAAASALSRSRPPWRSERTSPLWRSTLTCMLTVGWARRNSTASSPTVLGAVASECRRASRVGSATALSRRATDSVRARATTSPWPTPVPMTTRSGNSRYMLEPKNRQGTKRSGLPGLDVRHDLGQPLREDVTPRRYQ